jgi:hypothetical protein
MFDALLSLVERKQVQLIEIYLKEREEKGEGLFTIIHDGNKADIRYYPPDGLPYPEIAEEYKTKRLNVTNSDNNLERSSKLSHRKGYKMCEAHLITFPYDEVQLKATL